MLESIGVLAIVVLGFFLFMNYIENKDVNDRKRQNMIKNSWKCGSLIREYNKSLEDGNSKMTYDQLQKKIDEILKNKEDRDEILETIKRKEDNEIERAIENRNKRKVGYKYEEEIFKIFNDNTELSKEDLIIGVRNQFKIHDSDGIMNLLEVFESNSLIELCFWNKNNYEIGYILKYELYKIDNEDLIWSEWIKKNNIKLKPESEELKKHFK